MYKYLQCCFIDTMYICRYAYDFIKALKRLTIYYFNTILTDSVHISIFTEYSAHTSSGDRSLIWHYGATDRLNSYSC